MAEFMAEAFTMSVFGSIIGSMAGALLAYFGCRAVGMEAHFSLASFMSVVFIAILTGVVFGAYPSAKAAKLDPVEALRRE